MSTIPGTPIVTTTLTPSPVLPSPPFLDLSSEVPTPTSLVFFELLLGMTRLPLTSSRSSGMSVSASLSTSSWIVEPEQPRELEDEEAMRMSQMSTEPSLLSTPRASRMGSVVSDQSLSTIMPSTSISVSTPAPASAAPPVVINSPTTWWNDAQWNDARHGSNHVIYQWKEESGACGRSYNTVKTVWLVV
ncbi:hypothetical protein E1B28_011858 [Marasmius oreades]|uniref:Uncharacterized protein n=1 Tax=Marasmius oreades TaxID=181124 RepID=A0A9P7RW29_9AGAR|nr:uncharacterized protein E1B28_011858 [Marasmius oreades]KAG7090261.1 hypothetical protein E1B28_011858 [Marasmius oreades]